MQHKISVRKYVDGESGRGKYSYEWVCLCHANDYGFDTAEQAGIAGNKHLEEVLTIEKEADDLAS